MVGICKLCGASSKLRKSHILPEFCYQRLYDPLHRYNIVSNDPSVQIGQQQKGLRERLLCQDCESKFSRWETYSSSVLRGSVKGVRSGDSIFLEGLNYAHLKLFLLSLIWRAGVSTQRVFQETKLGEHEDIIRRMLLDERPGDPSTYGCLVYSVTIDGYRFCDVIYGPQPCLLENILSYRVMVSGMLFVYFISATPLKIEILKKFLNKAGQLQVEEKDISEIPFLNDLAMEVANFRSQKNSNNKRYTSC